MMTRKAMAALGISLAVAVPAVVLWTGCDVGSGDDAYINLPIRVSGVYANPSGGRLVSQNTGAAITQLDLQQTGDQLEGVDNNGLVYSGSIGEVFAGTPVACSFVIEGNTSSGQRGTMSGTITITGGKGVMNGRWSEPSLYGTIYGEATGPTASTNSPIVNPTNTTSFIN